MVDTDSDAADEPRWSSGLLFLGALVLTVLAAGGIGWALRPDSPAPAPGGPAAGAPAASLPATASPVTTPARPANAGLLNCQREIATADAVVAAARAGVGHWDEHVRARDDLLSGANTEAETKAIWKRTRLAGPADLTRYTAATTAHTAVRGSCARAVAAAEDTAALTACRTREQALATALRTGATGIADWKGHLDMMASHAGGDIDSIHAQEMWVSQWKAAPPKIAAFTAADEALGRAPTCAH